MRLILAVATFAALALPAHAQRVDTRQIDIRETAAGRTCSFNAYPDITLVDARKGRDANLATWRKSAQGLPAGDTTARMELIFGPADIGERKWMTPPVLGLGFTIRAAPYKAEGQFQTCGIISKEIEGVVQEHRQGRCVDQSPGRDSAESRLRSRRHRKEPQYTELTEGS